MALLPRSNNVAEVINTCGGQAKVARLLGISRCAVSQWRTSVPIDKAMLLLLHCEQKGIKVKERQFIPEIYQKAIDLNIWPDGEV